MMIPNANSIDALHYFLLDPTVCISQKTDPWPTLPVMSAPDPLTPLPDPDPTSRPLTLWCQSHSPSSLSSWSSSPWFSTGGSMGRMLASRSLIASINTLTPCLRLFPSSPPTAPSFLAGGSFNVFHMYNEIVMYYIFLSKCNIIILLKKKY